MHEKVILEANEACHHRQVRLSKRVSLPIWDRFGLNIFGWTQIRYRVFSSLESVFCFSGSTHYMLRVCWGQVGQPAHQFFCNRCTQGATSRVLDSIVRDCPSFPPPPKKTLAPDQKNKINKTINIKICGQNGLGQ